MRDPLDVLENRMAGLRRAIRGAFANRELERVRELRAELQRAEQSWDALVTPSAEPDENLREPVTILTAREQVYQALTLLGVPAALRLIRAAHSVFLGGPLAPSGLASLRRDEERSYRSAPAARPYYLCPALSSGPLSPARALVCVSTWPLEQRIIGPLSPRADFLTAAVRVAGAVAALGETGADRPEAGTLLRQFAVNIPGAASVLPGNRYPRPR